MTDKDFQAEIDMDALVRAKEIESDPARMASAKRFAEDRREQFARIAQSLPGKSARKFNGAVKDSKML